MNKKHIAIIWQRFLPYHIARIKHVNKRLSELGFRLTAIEIASQDASYGFPQNTTGDIDYICCFRGGSYHDHSAGEIRGKVLEVLSAVKPDVVFSPAIAFPEGIAAVEYRLKSGARSVIMDDAWENTDRRGLLVKLIKQLIYRNADVTFIPAASHLSYYIRLGFENDRAVFGVDVVDNGYFSKQVERVRLQELAMRDALQLPHNFFLFVGRVLPRKGIETLLKAYKEYRETAKEESWDLVLIGAGAYPESLRSQSGEAEGVCIRGAQYGDELCKYYGLAGVLVVPSYSDPWGLVVNEAMASGLPVIVSRGCGAAKTLVQEGKNGWTFEPGDAAKLSQLMMHISSLSAGERDEMGRKAQLIIAAWSLDRFADGVLEAIEIPRRQPAGLISDILTKLWKGRVRTT